jgi:hypothetical protein
VTDFEGELFLRRAGARLFGEDARPFQHDRPLHAMASALVAVGCVPEEVASCLVQDWFTAEEVRDQGLESVLRFFPSSREDVWPEGADVLHSGARFLTSGTVVELAWGTIEFRYLRLSTNAASVTVTMVQSEELHGTGTGLYPAPWGNNYPDPLTLTDDRGTTLTATAWPSGVCTAEVWHATFETDGPLALDTAWIGVDGHRLALTDIEDTVEVRVEALTGQSPAREHMWRRVAEHFDEPPCFVKTPLEPTIEALVAAGELGADDPDVLDALAVVKAAAVLDGSAIFDQHRRLMALGRPADEPTPSDSPVDEPPPRALPEPWASLLAARIGDTGPEGLTGLAIIGATTPTFDGVTIQLVALDSTPSGFTLDVRIHDRASVQDGHLHRNDPQVTWWAKDDRGNHYLGHLGRHGSWSHVRSGVGQVRFWHALDPSATWLDIMPTAPTSRAVLRVPLVWNR